MSRRVQHPSLELTETQRFTAGKDLSWLGRLLGDQIESARLAHQAPIQAQITAVNGHRGARRRRHFARAEDVIEVSVRVHDPHCPRPHLGKQSQDSPRIAARIDDQGLVRGRTNDNRAVASQGPHGKAVAKHGPRLSRTT